MVSQRIIAIVVLEALLASSSAVRLLCTPVGGYRISLTFQRHLAPVLAQLLWEFTPALGNYNKATGPSYLFEQTPYYSMGQRLLVVTR